MRNWFFAAILGSGQTSFVPVARSIALTVAYVPRTKTVTATYNTSGG